MSNNEMRGEGVTPKPEFPARGWVLSLFLEVPPEEGEVKNATIFFVKPGTGHDHPRVTEYLSLQEHEHLLAQASTPERPTAEELAFTPPQIDKVVCDWSMATGTALTEKQLNSLVNFLYHNLPPMQASPAPEEETSLRNANETNRKCLARVVELEAKLAAAEKQVLMLREALEGIIRCDTMHGVAGTCASLARAALKGMP